VSVAACVYLELDLVADAENEVAGVLHAISRMEPQNAWSDVTSPPGISIRNGTVTS